MYCVTTVVNGKTYWLLGNPATPTWTEHLNRAKTYPTKEVAEAALAKAVKLQPVSGHKAQIIPVESDA